MNNNNAHAPISYEATVKVMKQVLITAAKTLEENSQLIDEIVPCTVLTHKQYKNLMLQETREELAGECAFVPKNHGLDEILNKTRGFVTKKLQRDKRLFVDHKQRLKEKCRLAASNPKPT